MRIPCTQYGMLIMGLLKLFQALAKHVPQFVQQQLLTE